jgi:endonuclease/exonuclease/phosphatase (EEP) superfamily protein YafD
LPRPLRALLTVAGLALLPLAPLGLIVRHQPVTDDRRLIVAVGAPYAALTALAALLLFAVCRRWVLAVIAVVVAVAGLLPQASWYYAGQPSATAGQQTHQLRVLSSNLRYGRADPRFLVDLVTREADLFAVAELTPAEVRRFADAGLDRVMPYSMLLPAPDAGGIGLWSRFPIEKVAPVDRLFVAQVTARLKVPGLRNDPFFTSLHIIAPHPDMLTEWRQGIESARLAMDELAERAAPGAVIVAGDYNSTPDLQQFRRLLDSGFRDAVQQSGAGFAPTFPSDAWYPPLITIDHIMTRNASASSVHTVHVPDSDHRALLATVEVPVDPTAS